MENNIKKGSVRIILIVILVIIVAIGIYFFSNNKVKTSQVSTPKGEVEDWKNYKNSEYGFGINFPDSWKGYTIEKTNWDGIGIDTTNEQQKYTGTLLVFKNPQGNSEHMWQDIPIMVFTPDIWKLVVEEKIAVSAAPIGPSKIGENEKYIFATSPRWYGFTDTGGVDEAIAIVKTFKAE
jgi:hypothetical protein